MKVYEIVANYWVRERVNKTPPRRKYHHVRCAERHRLDTCQDVAELLTYVLSHRYRTSRKADHYVINDVVDFINKEPRGLTVFMPGVAMQYTQAFEAHAVILSTVHCWRDGICFIRVFMMDTKPIITPSGIPLFGRHADIDPLLALTAMERSKALELFEQEKAQLNERFPGIAQYINSYAMDHVLQSHTHPAIIKGLKIIVFDQGHMVVVSPFPKTGLRIPPNEKKGMFILASPVGLHYLFYHRYTPPKTFSSLLRHNGIHCTEYSLSQWSDHLGLQILLGLERVKDER